MLRIRSLLVAGLAVIPLAAAFVACGGNDPLDAPAAGSGAAGMGAAGQPPAGDPAGRGAAASSANFGGTAGSGTAGSGAAGTSAGGGAALHGYFNVTLNPALEETNSPPSTSFLGKLYDGPSPSPQVWTKKMEAGGCRLYTPTTVFCDPTCAGGTVCTADDTCTAYPKQLTAGTVTLTGIGPKVDMEPKANSYQPPAGTALPYPPCTAGAEVKLSAAGGSHAPFSLSATCIEPLVLAAGLRITKGQPLALSWNAGPSNMQVNINVELDISHHGGSKGQIHCDVADTGSLSIPAAMMDALVELGVSGFPTVLVTREFEGGAADGGPANVFLKLSSPYRREVEIPGLVSCNDSSQCPAGQTCKADLKCE